MTTSTTWRRLLSAPHLPDSTTADPRVLAAAARAAARDRDRSLAVQLLPRIAAAGGHTRACDTLAWAVDDRAAGAWLAAATADEPSFEPVLASTTRSDALVFAAEYSHSGAVQHRLADTGDHRIRVALWHNPRLDASVAADLAATLPAHRSRERDLIFTSALNHLDASAAAALAALPDDRGDLALRVASANLRHRHRDADVTSVADATIDRLHRRAFPAPDDAANDTQIAGAVVALPDTATALLDDAALDDDGFPHTAAAVRSHTDLRDRLDTDATLDADLIHAAFPAHADTTTTTPRPPDRLLARVAAADGLTAAGAATLIANTVHDRADQNVASQIVARFGVDALIHAGGGTGLWHARHTLGAGAWWPAGGDAALGRWAATSTDPTRDQPPRILAVSHDARLTAAALPHLPVRQLLRLAADTVGRHNRDDTNLRDRLILRALARVDELGDDAATLASDFDGTTDTLAATTDALTGPSQDAPT